MSKNISILVREAKEYDITQWGIGINTWGLESISVRWRVPGGFVERVEATCDSDTWALPPGKLEDLPIGIIDFINLVFDLHAPIEEYDDAEI